MMIALVIVAGKAMAQGNTASTPFVGSKFTYTVNGLFNTDTYQFVVTANTNTAPALTSVAGTVYSFDVATNGTGTVSGGEASVEITWNTPGSYNLWLQVTKPSTTCSNYRYVPITVQPDYTMTLAILALGKDEGAAGVTGNGNTSVESECSTPEANYLYTPQANNNGGNTVVYYKVTRTTAAAGVDNAWTFTPTCDNITGAPVTQAFDYKLGTTGTYGAWASGAIAVPSGTNEIYVRVTRANDIASDNLIRFDGSGADTNTNKTSDPAAATQTIERLPSIGTFVGM